MTSSFLPYKNGRRPQYAPATAGAADYLRAHDKLAALLPAVTRMADLQKDCASLLPASFGNCSVIQYSGGQLVISTPNAAIAAKLKQQLPKLQEGLGKMGWQVSSIRLKVQVAQSLSKSIPSKQLQMPATALGALSELERNLETSPRNAALKAALAALVKRHKGIG